MNDKKAAPLDNDKLDALVAEAMEEIVSKRLIPLDAEPEEMIRILNEQSKEVYRKYKESSGRQD